VAAAVAAACHTANGSVVRLGVHIDFPTCWDGRLNDHSRPGNTADYSGDSTFTGVNHFAYAIGPNNNRSCPSGFNARKVPFLRMTLQFDDWRGNDYRGNGRDLALSSGPHDASGNPSPAKPANGPCTPTSGTPGSKAYHAPQGQTSKA
jgi:hypothetical protein